MRYWPLISSFVGVLVGSAISWTTIKVKSEARLDQLTKDVGEHKIWRLSLEERLRSGEEVRNARHVEVTSRLSAIEAALTYLKAMFPGSKN